MAYIPLKEGLPGIRGLLAFRKQTTKPLLEFTDALLKAPSDLSKGDRELIATYVSYLNDCNFCQNTHGAAAAHHYGGKFEIIRAVKNNVASAPVSEKLKTLLNIAAKVQKGGKYVTERDIEAARNTGASDIDIHDTVLIAAAFCMFNRYVDGLNTWAPTEQEVYTEIGKKIAEEGYMREDAKKMYGI